MSNHSQNTLTSPDGLKNGLKTVNGFLCQTGNDHQGSYLIVFYENSVGRQVAQRWRKRTPYDIADIDYLTTQLQRQGASPVKAALTAC